MMETLSRFSHAYRKKNLEEIMATLAAGAQVVSADGQLFKGEAAIRKRLLLEFQQTSAEKIVPRWFEIQETPEGGQFHSEYEMVERRNNAGVCVSRGSFHAKLTHRGRQWQIAQAVFRVQKETTGA